MTDHELEYKLRVLVNNERAITTEILELILIAETRGLPLQRGFPNTLEWLVSEFKYSESAAYRRIQAARLIKDLPKLAAKLSSGSLNLTNMAKAQSLMRKQEKIAKMRFSPEAKAKIVERIEGLTGKQADQILFEVLPHASQKIREDHLRQIDAERSRLSVTLTLESLEKLNQVRNSLGGKYVDMNLSETIEHLIDRAASELAQRSKKNSGDLPPHNTAAVKQRGKTRSRTIPAQVQRAVRGRAGNRCEYFDKITSRKCESQRHLEFDHIHPWSLGGSHSFENIRLLCRNHNQMFGKKIFGEYPNPVKLNSQSP